MAIIDAYSGVDVLGLVMVIVIFALAAVDFDILSRVSIERLTMIGDDDSPIPWHAAVAILILKAPTVAVIPGG